MASLDSQNLKQTLNFIEQKIPICQENLEELQKQIEQKIKDCLDSDYHFKHFDCHKVGKTMVKVTGYSTEKKPAEFISYLTFKNNQKAELFIAHTRI